MAYPEDDIIIFNNEDNFAKLDTPEGELYENGLFAQLISGFDNLAQGWDVYGVVEVGPGQYEQGPIYEDVAAGGLGSDTLYGEMGDDVLYGGTGYYLDLDNTQEEIIDVPTPRPPFNSFGDPLDNHSFDGFDFDDFVTSNYNAPFSRYDAAGDELHGGEGNDTIFGQLGKDTLYGDSGEDSIFGGRHGDYMDGGSEGDDMFGERGLDTMYGGNEFGAWVWSFREDFWQWEQNWYYRPGDWMSGGRARDWMHGGAGFDTMYGNQCADTMYGSEGFDLMFGGNGDDYMRGDDEQGWDTGDALTCYWANIQSCEYRVGYSGNGDSMFGGYGDDLMYGGIGDDLMRGNARNDTMYGEEDDDLMTGNRGDDWMSGGEGCDDMSGGSGNDTMTGDAGADNMFGNSGEDDMSGGDGDDVMRGGTENDDMRGDAGHDTMYGEDGDDDMQGNDGNDWMYGNVGADVMDGGNDDDVMCGGDDNDTMYGGAGNDQVHGEDGQDVLFGDYPEGDDSDGNDTLNGGDGADTMIGGGGDDVIYFEGATISPWEEGGLYEIAEGGDGADTFVYNFSYPGDTNANSVGDSGWALVTDFSTDDFLQLCLSGDITPLECDYGQIDQPNLNDLAIINGQLIDKLNEPTTDGQSPITVHDNGVDTWIIFDNTNPTDQDDSDPEDLIDQNIWLKGVTGLETDLNRTFASLDDMIEAGYDIKIAADLPSEKPEGLDEDYNYNGEGGFLDRYYAQFEPCEVECPEPFCDYGNPFEVA